MSYELFEKAAAINSQFEIIPTKTSIFAKGIVIDNNGYMHYKGKKYIPNLVKLEDLPTELRNLFLEKKLPTQDNTPKNIGAEAEKNENESFNNLNKILFDQLEKIANPKGETDISQELKKANTICNVADKIISIADLSLKAEMFNYKKKYPSGKSLYQD
ncbi:hypothetical protein O8C86_05725 [Aliarcobacter butzleri]|uniref:hypothetical protein n=2 Tax=Aliarcobacter butzleri TaxID=28197 RepID=UPI00263DA645|nr:hypothetical protein [Aliarcobacter butzleri]MDN5061340.1 hypothetical protein [Aliarcobacter butzleri]